MRHLLALFLLAVPMQAQQPVVSPQVGPDGSVTFRILAPNAKDVLVVLEGTQRVLLHKDAQGVWSGASGPLEPDLYGYVFVVDGLSVIDPSNPRMKPNLLNTQSVVHVPGPATLPWEIGDAARGTLHRHFYKSGIVGDDRDFYVYTPAGYHAGSRSAYPVLYLLHGFSDDASAWTSVGQAHVILDNLIAAGKVRPMLVVMPLGYGAPEILKRAGPRDPALSRKNMELFRDTLLQEVMPQVERQYRVSKDRKDRAIAGLSMGGSGIAFCRAEHIEPLRLDRGFQLRKSRRRPQCRLPGAGRSRQHTTESPLDCVRQGGSSHRGEQKAARVVRVQGCPLHLGRVAGSSRLDGLEALPGRIHAPAVSVSPTPVAWAQPVLLAPILELNPRKIGVGIGIVIEYQSPSAWPPEFRFDPTPTRTNLR